MAELFRKYGSDKDRNGYTSLYHILFHGWRQKPVRVMEIGIGTMIEGAPSSMRHYGLPGYAPGGSLRAWRDYFPQGVVVGVDIQPDTQFTDEPRITTELCDSRDPEQVVALMERLSSQPNQEETPEFDLILDDGCHLGESQFKTLKNLFPYVKSGGYYVVEDVTPHSSISQFPELVRQIVGHNTPLFYSGLKNNLCIIHKSELRYSALS